MSPHLLRTFATVVPGTRVLVAERTAGEHSGPLQALGLAVIRDDVLQHEAEAPEWAVVDVSFDAEVLADIHQQLKMGGWAYLVWRSAGTAPPPVLEAAFTAAGFVPAGQPVRILEEGAWMWIQIVRKVDATTPV